VNGITVASQDNVADTLTSYFSDVASSFVNYTVGFLQLRALEESHHLNFATGASLIDNPFLW
jgi:uncharacterized membrane protein YdcZ (DUF606 family)